MSWQSGRLRLLGKLLGVKKPRGFESHTYLQIMLSWCNGKHGGLRNHCRKAYRFESYREYQINYGDFSLFGKATDCESEEQGSNPEVTPN